MTIDNLVRKLKHPDIIKTVWTGIGGDTNKVNTSLEHLDTEVNELLATGWRIMSVQMHGGNDRSNSLLLYVLMKDGEIINESA